MRGRNCSPPPYRVDKSVDVYISTLMRNVSSQNKDTELISLPEQWVEVHKTRDFESNYVRACCFEMSFNFIRGNSFQALLFVKLD